MVGVIGWIKRKGEEFKEAQDRAKEEQERQRQAQLKALEEKQYLRRKREEAEHQRRRNVLSILDKGMLPDPSWGSFGHLPFKFQKSEHLIHIFRNVKYLEQRVKREIVGRSTGASFRVAKGVSIRTSGSRGTPVERDVIVPRGIGTMAVTTKHLYFNGERSFRIPFSKMVSVEPMRDGVSVTRDRASALAEFFVVGNRDADFTYELLQAIPSLELPRSPELRDPERYHLLMLEGNGDGMIEVTDDG